MNERSATSTACAPGSAVHVCRFPVAYDAAAETFWVCGHSLPSLTRDVSDFCGETCLDPDGRLRRHDNAAALRREAELRTPAEKQINR
ncbi:hypothetical protein DFR70_102997 [Nocardia tenerifensis]|uniref:Uncharacterized protein n=1 Tax=Nocardia tenerifensis TaxID=228006 RepID=A0A318K7J1_9NOCA|nr:hypothetical protein DFR70_102997 [Nocardia tenerifensis]